MKKNLSMACRLEFSREREREKELLHKQATLRL